MLRWDEILTVVWWLQMHSCTAQSKQKVKGWLTLVSCCICLLLSSIVVQLVLPRALQVLCCQCKNTKQYVTVCSKLLLLYSTVYVKLFSYLTLLSWYTSRNYINQILSHALSHTSPSRWPQITFVDKSSSCSHNKLNTADVKELNSSTI